MGTFQSLEHVKKNCKSFRCIGPRIKICQNSERRMGAQPKSRKKTGWWFQPI